MNKITGLLIFASGAAIGSVVTWKVLENRYEQLFQEEIESMKDMFEKRPTVAENTDEETDSDDTQSETEVRAAADNAKVKPSITEYASVLQKNEYTDYSSISAKEEAEKKNEETDKPYTISPEEFGEFEDYTQISLTYYADGILTDENDEVIEDVEEVVGYESLAHIGQFEEDAVHVRNDRLKCDYEILQVLDKYSDD